MAYIDRQKGTVKIFVYDSIEVDTYGQDRDLWAFIMQALAERLLYYTVSHLWLVLFLSATIPLLALLFTSGLYQNGIASVAWR